MLFSLFPLLRKPLALSKTSSWRYCGHILLASTCIRVKRYVCECSALSILLLLLLQLTGRIREIPTADVWWRKSTAYPIFPEAGSYFTIMDMHLWINVWPIIKEMKSHAPTHAHTCVCVCVPVCFCVCLCACMIIIPFSAKKSWCLLIYFKSGMIPLKNRPALPRWRSRSRNQDGNLAIKVTLNRLRDFSKRSEAR